jgi:hypothetical protein
LILWGSFVTGKESPNDLDVLLLMGEHFDIETLPEDSRPLFHHGEARIRFRADVFWSREAIGEDMIRLLLDTYQTSKDLKRRGIVEVMVS